MAAGAPVSVATKLLDRLERVKQTGANRWVARCPAHEDRSPSLSVRELDDGKILLHDFGGCDNDAILAAVGLTMSDLFPDSCHLPAIRSRIPARDLLEIISEETSVVAILAADILKKRTIAEQDWGRLARAVARIGRARDHAFGQ